MTNHEHVSAPIEPTEEMIEAAIAAWPKSARKWYKANGYPELIYKAMLAAAPRTEREEKGQN